MITHQHLPVTSAQQSRANRLPYFRSLDGLRGLAVLWVMGFHAGLAGFRGGYLGVSAFFTLSGFLLTTLALAERHDTGRISLRGFWARRFRRLMPAALVTIAAVVVMGSRIWSADQLTRLRGDVLASLLYVANWRMMFSEDGYAQAFQEPSPLQHFWSLAIEEQFYILFPLVLAVVFLTRRHVRRALGVVFLAVAVGSAITMALVYDAASSARAYLGTGTRIGEIAIGCLLAVLVNARPHIQRARLRSTVGWLGLVALAASLVAWVTVDIESPWLYHGGFTLHALAIALVLLAAVQSTGPLRVVLGLRPIVWLGVVSYGVYLYHWPIFLWLDHARTGLSGFPLFVVQVALTLAVAAASYRLLELPARREKLLSGWRPALVAPVLVVAVVVGSFVITAPERRGGATALSVVTPDLVAPDAPPPTGPAALDATQLGRIDPPKVALFGDSVGLTVSIGLDAKQEELGVSFWNRAHVGCGVVRSGTVALRNRITTQNTGCNTWPSVWREQIEEFDPDVAVLLAGAWDMIDREIDGEWLSFGTRQADAYILDELRLAADVLGRSGALVVFLTTPYFYEHLNNSPDGAKIDEFAPWRIDHWNSLLRHIAAERPEQVVVIDTGSHLAPDGAYTPTIDGIEVRGDGVHLSVDGTMWLADWLGPHLRFLGGMHSLPRPIG